MSAPFVHIPLIETERLTVRAPHVSDGPAYTALLASPCSLHVGGRHAEVDASDWVASDLAHWAFFENGTFWIEDREACATVRQAGILNPLQWPQAKPGSMILEGCEGHRYASDAAVGMRGWSHARHPAPVQLVRYVHPENTGSIAAMTRLGARLDATWPCPSEGDRACEHSAADTWQ